MQACLKMVKGRGAGTSYPLPSGRRLTFGNGEGCDVLLGEVGVSRRHFALEWDGKNAILTDLGSTNGTYVNGQKIASSALLQDDMVVAGQMVMQLVFQRDDQSRPPQDSVRFVDEPFQKKAGDIYKKLQKTERLFIDSIIEVYAGEKMDRLNRALTILYRVSNILSTARVAEPMLEQVMKEICDAFKPDAGVLLLAREGAEALDSKVVWIRDSRAQSNRIPLSRTVIESCVKGGLAVLTNDPQSDERFASSKSICDYRIKSVLCVPLEAQQRTLGAIYLDYATDSSSGFQEADLDLLGAIGKEVGLAIERLWLSNELRTLSLNSVRALVAAIEAKDPYTSGHSERVARLAMLLAEEVGMSDAELEFMQMAAILHDVGKIGIPEAIIQKAGRLTPAEYEVMKKHPAISEKILREFAQNERVLSAIKYHHERPDGKGYPDGLLGEAIPLMARTIAVADAWDAMVTERSYKPCMPADLALSEVQRCRGSQFDPRVCDALLRLQERGALAPVYAELASGHAQPPAVLPVSTATVPIQVPVRPSEADAGTRTSATPTARVPLPGTEEPGEARSRPPGTPPPV